LEALTQANDKCDLVRIDIDQWGSPVAEQFDIRSLPTVWLYKGSDLQETEAMQIVQQIRRLN
jgi:thioredoxin-like negative regulator of GroEL